MNYRLQYLLVLQHTLDCYNLCMEVHQDTDLLSCIYKLLDMVSFIECTGYRIIENPDFDNKIDIAFTLPASKLYPKLYPEKEVNIYFMIGYIEEKYKESNND